MARPARRSRRAPPPAAPAAEEAAGEPGGASGLRAAAQTVRDRAHALPLTRAERTLALFVVGTGLAGLLLLAWRSVTAPRFQATLVQGTPGIRAPADLGAVRLSRAGAELPLDVNAAGALQLQVLPGVGKKTAFRIVEERGRDGPFRSVDDLARVDGMTPRKLARLRPYVVVRGAGARPGPRPPEPTPEPGDSDD